MSASSTFESTIRTLEQDPNVSRIKKLAICACQNRWESDASKLAATSLADLVKQLMAAAPTPEQLKGSLNTVVRGLTKPVEYALVASNLIEQITPLYSLELEEQTQFFPAGNDADDSETHFFSAAAQQSPLEAIANTIETSMDGLRAKKLLICACRQTWETNTVVLNKTQFPQLLREILTLAPNSTQLQFLLNQAVKTLTKPIEYSLLANQLIQILDEQFYQTAAGQRLIQSYQTPDAQTGSSIDHTSAALERARSALDDQTQAFVAESTQAFVPPSGNTDDSYGAVPGLGTDEFEDDWQPPELDTASSPEETAGAVRDRFDLRAEIMRYANPLRVKILLFSVLEHQFEFNDLDWAALRSRSLDILLAQAFQKYPKLKDMESNLEIMAHCLPESDHMMQTIGVLSRILKLHYAAWQKEFTAMLQAT